MSHRMRIALPSLAAALLVLAGHAAASSTLPELVPRDIAWQPVKPTNGSTVTFTVAVMNAGNAPSGSFAVRILIDGASIGEGVVPPLAAGEMDHAVIGPWHAVVGPHLVEAVVDPADEVDEWNEGNNAVGETMLVYPFHVATPPIWYVP